MCDYSYAMAVGSYHTSLALQVAEEYEEPAKLWELHDTPSSAHVAATDATDATAQLPIVPRKRLRGPLPQPSLCAASAELINTTAEGLLPLSSESMSTEELMDTSAEALLPTSMEHSFISVPQQQQEQQQQKSDWCSDWSAQLQEVVDSVAQSKRRKDSSSVDVSAGAAAAAVAAMQNSSRKRSSSSDSTADSSSGSSTEQSNSDSCGDYYTAPPASVQHALVSNKRQCLDMSMQSTSHIYAVDPEQWQGRLWITRAELLQQRPLECVERVYTLTGS